jgi:hypothetical protein
MSLVWFGDVSKRSGAKILQKKGSRVRGVWPLLWLLQLLSWMLAPLMRRSTPSFREDSRKRRGSYQQQRLLRPMHMSSSGVTVTLTPRGEGAPLVTIHNGLQTTSVYGIAAARVHLRSHGLEKDDPLMEWLWALQEPEAGA